MSGLDFLNPEKMKINSFHVLTAQSQGTHSVILTGDQSYRLPQLPFFTLKHNQLRISEAPDTEGVA